MKSFTTIDNLRTMFKEDFSKGYENQFVKLKEDIIRELQESKRSLEDHKIEAMAIIKEHEHSELMAGVALGISVSSMVMTLVLRLWLVFFGLVLWYLNCKESSTKKLLIMQSSYTVSRLWRKEHRQK